MPAKNSRNVALTDEQNELVNRLLQSGRYASASEIVRDGLRLLQRDVETRLLEKWLLEGLTPEEEASVPKELLARARDIIRSKIQEGLDAADRGDFIDGEEFFARWEARLNELAKARAEPRSKPGS